MKLTLPIKVTKKPQECSPTSLFHSYVLYENSFHLSMWGRTGGGWHQTHWNQHKCNYLHTFKCFHNTCWWRFSQRCALCAGGWGLRGILRYCPKHYFCSSYLTSYYCTNFHGMSDAICTVFVWGCWLWPASVGHSHQLLHVNHSEPGLTHGKCQLWVRSLMVPLRESVRRCVGTSGWLLLGVSAEVSRSSAWFFLLDQFKSWQGFQDTQRCQNLFWF